MAGCGTAQQGLAWLFKAGEASPGKAGTEWRGDAGGSGYGGYRLVPVWRCPAWNGRYGVAW